MKVNIIKLHCLTGHLDCVYTLENNHSNGHFFSAGGDGIVAMWDLKKPESGLQLAKMNNSVYALHLLKAHNTLIVGQNFEGLHFIDLTNKNEIGSLKLSQSQIFDIKSHDDRIFVASGDGAFYILDSTTCKIAKRIKVSDRSIRCIAINTHLGELAIGLSDNTIRIFDLKDFKQKYSIMAHKLSVFALKYTPDNKYLISASRDAHLKVWDPYDHYSLANSIVAHMYAINSIDFSHNGKYFATGSMDKSIKIWDAGNFKLLKVVDKSRHGGHATSVNKVCWSPTEDLLMTGSDDKTISVWDLQFIY